MAERNPKTQSGKGSGSRNTTKKSTSSKAKSSTKDTQKATKQATPRPSQPKPKVPARLISAQVFLVLFAIFLFAAIVPGGALFVFCKEFVTGLIGKTAFYISIPALLYLFAIHAFGNNESIVMRSILVGVFVISCGAISQLAKLPIPGTTDSIKSLYLGGISGTTSGVICGSVAIFMEFCCTKIPSYIILGITALLTLLGSMQITFNSIFQAIMDRPKDEWDNYDEEEVRREPAAVVVDHIANKRNAYIERRRLIQEEEDDKYEDDIPDIPVVTLTPTKKAKAIISQIDADVDDPVAASSTGTSDVVEEEIIPLMTPVKTNTSKMPLLAPDHPVQNVDMPVPVQAEPVVPAPIPEAIVDTKKEKVTTKDAEESAEEVAKEIALSDAVKAEKPEYRFPPIDLLKLPNGGSQDGTAEMRENSRRLNETLESFKIEAHIINVTRGPSVTRYEVELEKGVRLSKLTTAADDIALSLGASGVRIAAIPGKISVVGIEVPNRAVTMVSLREVIDSTEFNKAKSKSSFAVGKDIGGTCIVGNIAKLPHMLIAGTTGSGKSVCMNSIIISLLYKASPDDVKLIMVDPKMVELGIYNSIPHLLIPVVTDPKKAAGSLQWAVAEMMRRYKSMSDAGVRDLESYNSIIESQEVDGVKLPQIVVIIDELADLMLVAAKEVEESICRIAQMGRAAGIHLIIATQRPSADVITGLMKANIPSRIAFAVASAMESRIILDTQGAEKLVGKGDMLYAPIGTGKPTRVQGCFVSDSEVEAVATYVKANYVTNYDEEIMEEIEKKAIQTGNNKTSQAEPEPSSDELSGDEMLPAAVDVILETGQASVSMLQRRLKLGYARAARIVDEMEERGIVGPFVGSKPRAILVTKEQWESMKNNQMSPQLGFDDLPEEETLD